MNDQQLLQQDEFFELNEIDESLNYINEQAEILETETIEGRIKQGKTIL